jgi:hypothetical protein
MQKALRLFVIVLFLVITVAAATSKPEKVVNSGISPMPMCDPGTPGCTWPSSN